MQIICETDREWQVAREQLEKQGYMWASNHRPTELYSNKRGNGTLTLDEKTKTLTGGNRQSDAVKASKLYANLLRQESDLYEDQKSH